MDLIEIELHSKEKTHPNYTNLDLDIVCNFGYLLLNYKPDTVLKILDFIKVEDP
jgi:hypothetical protein